MVTPVVINSFTPQISLSTHEVSISMIAWEIECWVQQIWLLSSLTLGMVGERGIKALPCKYLIAMVISVKDRKHQELCLEVVIVL